MKYIRVFEKFDQPFKSFNPYVNLIMKGLDEIYVRDNIRTDSIRTGIINKNSGKLDILSGNQMDKKTSRMMVQIKYYGNSIKISITTSMIKQLEYLNYLCSIFCKNAPSNYPNQDGDYFIQQTNYFLPLDKVDEFIKRLTLEEENVYNTAKKYNV